jgi:hypothetical protein
MKNVTGARGVAGGGAEPLGTITLYGMITPFKGDAVEH